jgi:hypothetical protein
MADERFSSSRAGDADTADGSRGSRPSGGRDGGGFRIRLSDNEMQGARALQEAFGLRSTVAVLGFSLRTLAQMMEQGQLDELIAQHRAQAGSRPAASREGGRGERRRDRSNADRDGDRGGRGERIDPFARPARPAAPANAEEPVSEEPVSEEPVSEEPVSDDFQSPDGAEGGHEPLPAGESDASAEEAAATPAEA